MIRISKQHTSAVISWLGQSISPELTSGMQVNVHDQSATWHGEQDLWQVRQWAKKRYIEIQCADPHIETLIALKWGD